MSKKRVKEIAAMGGRASMGNFKHNPDRAREAGRKGGRSSSAN